MQRHEALSKVPDASSDGEILLMHGKTDNCRYHQPDTSPDARSGVLLQLGWCLCAHIAVQHDLDQLCTHHKKGLR